MTQEDRFGLLFLGYFALIVGAGVGVFARGATGLAVLLVVTLGGVAVMLLSLAGAAAREEREEREQLRGE